MENCTWIPKSQADIVVDDYGPWTPNAKELDRFIAELAGYMSLDPATVASQIDDEFVVVQHQTTGRLLVVYPAQGTVLEQFCPVGAGKRNLWLIGLGVVGGGIGYLVTRNSYGKQLIGVGAGAAVGVLGAFFLTKALPRELAGVPHRAIPAPRGAMGGYPRQVIPAPRGAMGAYGVRKYDGSGMGIQTNLNRGGCIAC